MDFRVFLCQQFDKKKETQNTHTTQYILEILRVKNFNATPRLAISPVLQFTGLVLPEQVHVRGHEEDLQKQGVHQAPSGELLCGQ